MASAEKLIHSMRSDVASATKDQHGAASINRDRGNGSVPIGVNANQQPRKHDGSRNQESP